MRTVEIDRTESGFRVSWIQGIQPLKARDFAERADAEAFAVAKMGARGCVISTLDMTADQLAQNNARKARAAAMLATLKGAQS